MIRSYKLLLAAAALLSFTCLSAQSVSKTHSLKAYSNFAYSNETKNEMFYKNSLVKSYESRYDLGYFTPAFTFYTENGGFHEIEMSRIKFGSEAYYINGNTDTLNYPHFPAKKIIGKTTNISLRYEYAYRLNVGDSDSKLNLYIGVSGNPYFLKEKLTPGSSEVSAESQSQLGLAIGAVPRIIYNITPNWFLDLNIPVSIVDFALIRFETSDPKLSLDFREINSTDLVLFPNNILLRFGVGLKI